MGTIAVILFDIGMIFYAYGWTPFLILGILLLLAIGGIAVYVHLTTVPERSEKEKKKYYDETRLRARKEAQEKFRAANIAAAIKRSVPNVVVPDSVAYAAASFYVMHDEPGEYSRYAPEDESEYAWARRADSYLDYVREALTPKDRLLAHLLKPAEAATRILEPPLRNQSAVGIRFSVVPTPEVAEEAIHAFIKELPRLPAYETANPDHPAFQRMRAPHMSELYLPPDARLAHHWIVGATGSGKTNALTTMILRDIDAVRQGKCSVIVIDSQRALIPDIAGLKVFAPGNPLHGRLVHLDPRDVEFPPALGLFDLDMSSASPLQKIQFQMASVNLLEFVLSSLVDQEMTGQMKTLLRSLVIALLAIPDATIHTMMEMLQKPPKQPFPQHIRPHIERLAPIPRSFFETQYDSREFQTTKDALHRRLYGLLLNPIFSRMFAHPHSKLRLKEEMGAGKVILIDTAKDLFGEEGAELLGRFFIALVGQASTQRSADSELPCYVYIDEAGDYLSKESSFPNLLDQARKKHIGLIIAHLRLSNLAPGTLDALQANARIRFAAVQNEDAIIMARNMNGTPEDVKRGERGSFSAYIHDVTTKPVRITFPLTDLKRHPRMTDAESEQVRAEMRRAYCAAAEASSPSALPPAPNDLPGDDGPDSTTEY